MLVMLGKLTRVGVCTLVLALIVSDFEAQASRTEFHNISGYKDFSDGDFQGASLLADGSLVSGPRVRSLASKISGNAITSAMGTDGSIYVSTAAPARLWRISKDGEAKIIYSVALPLITAIVPLKNGQIALLSSPEGGIHFISADTYVEKNFVKLPQMKMLLAAKAYGNFLYIVGGGETGKLVTMSLDGHHVSEAATIDERDIRTIQIIGPEKNPTIYFGGAQKGILYKLKGGNLSAVIERGAAEVTGIAIDDTGRVFVAMVYATEPSPDGAGQTAHIESELLKIDHDGRTQVIWRSEMVRIYSILLSKDQKKIFFGTGERGLLYAIDTGGTKKAEIEARLKQNREIVSLMRGKNGNLILTTSQQTGVFELLPEMSAQGAYVTKALSAGSMARYGAIKVNGLEHESGIRIYARTGNTSSPNDTWGDFVKPADMKPGQFVQVKLEIFPGAKVFDLRIGYQTFNRAAQIKDVRILPAGSKVKPEAAEVSRSQHVSFDENAFVSDMHITPTVMLHAQASSGDLSFEQGFRSFYAYAEDPDQDRLRYRYSLKNLKNGNFIEIKDWSEEPFLTIETSKFADGYYQLMVEVDDILSNGPQKMLGDKFISRIFQISNTLPKFVDAKANQIDAGVRYSFGVTSKVPLSVVRCSIAGSEWLPIDSKDGLVDGFHEEFVGILPGVARFKSISCKAVDENFNEELIDIELGK